MVFFWRLIRTNLSEVGGHDNTFIGLLIQVGLFNRLENKFSYFGTV